MAEIEIAPSKDPGWNGMPSPASKSIRLSVSFCTSIACDTSMPHVKYPDSFKTSVDSPLPHPMSKSKTALSGSSKSSSARSAS